MDYPTRIQCPDCKSKIVHRYRCGCDSVWNYCTSDSCNSFYCLGCDAEKKVGWSDEPRVVRESSGRTVSTAEKKVLRKLLAAIATPGCNSLEYATS